jgi:hypothetical protein
MSAIDAIRDHGAEIVRGLARVILNDAQALREETGVSAWEEAHRVLVVKRIQPDPSIVDLPTRVREILFFLQFGERWRVRMHGLWGDGALPSTRSARSLFHRPVLRSFSMAWVALEKLAEQPLPVRLSAVQERLVGEILKDHVVPLYRAWHQICSVLGQATLAVDVDEVWGNYADDSYNLVVEAAMAGPEEFVQSVMNAGKPGQPSRAQMTRKYINDYSLLAVASDSYVTAISTTRVAKSSTHATGDRFAFDDDCDDEHDD